MHNTGYLTLNNGTVVAVHLDVGKMSKDVRMKEPAYFAPDLEKVARKIDAWIGLNYPKYYPEISQAMEARLSKEIGKPFKFTDSRLVPLLKNSYKTVIAGLRYFIFAPECLECHELLKQDESYFCKICLSLFEFQNPEHRCNICFIEDEKIVCGRCRNCASKEIPYTKMGSVFEYEGPPAAMIRALKYGNQPQLAETVAAYMALQWIDLKWPKPDYLLAVPISWLKRIDRGYNQAELIAKHLSAIHEIPYFGGMKKSIGGVSQAGLGRKQRFAQELNTFYVRHGELLAEKTVLIIDDVMTTGRTVEACTRALQCYMPSDIYVLTFCRAF